MEGELQNFMRVWLTVVVSLAYCYSISKVVSAGPKRLVLLLPVAGLFFYLPLNLSSPHLCGTTSFFISWLANFKLLLFSCGQGPLASDPSISLPLFVAVACLPIKLQQNPSQKSKSKPRESPLNYAIKGLILVLMIKVYDYRDYVHPKMILVLYALHTYFALEIILAAGAAMARTMTGLELEPQFNEPYLSTSLQDFWGKRWNLMVPSILRPTVYVPSINVCSRVMGKKWAPLPAVFATFVVSGIMHELIFYYLSRVRPSWEVMGFFLLHGLCLTAEVALKKAIDGRWRLHGLISGVLTIGFVMTTSVWLFLPSFSKSQIDVRSLEEYAVIGASIRKSYSLLVP